jgi:hypothetical protein
MSGLKKVHIYKKVPNSTEVRLVETNPYINIAAAGLPQVFLQGGRYLYEDGTEIKELSSALKDEVAKLAPAALKEAGFDAEPTYKCAECGDEMVPRMKGVHIANHKKADEKAKKAAKKGEKKGG